MINPHIKFINGSFFINEPISTTFVVCSGFWKFELWGGSGGDSFKTSIHKSFPGGAGGYSVGVFFFSTETNISLNIGGHGLSNCSGSTGHIPGGFNGGGSGFIGGLFYPVGSGGGSSDIRIGGSEFEHRVIVAGGGGGAGAGNNNYEFGQFGGAGGGVYGLEGGGHSSEFDFRGGKGGDRATGGLGGYNSENQYGQNGSFFYGGSGSIGSITQSSAGGGGGGFYGGGGSTSSGGGGGSGFIGDGISKFGIKLQTISGNSTFPSPYGGFELGHIGDGCIKITYIDQNFLYTCNKLTINLLLVQLFLTFSSIFFLY